MKKIIFTIFIISFIAISCNKDTEDDEKENLPVFKFDPAKLKEITEDPAFANFDDGVYEYESFTVLKNGDTVSNPGHKIVYKYSKSKEYEFAGLKSKYSKERYFIYPDGSLGTVYPIMIYFQYENDYIEFVMDTTYFYLGELYNENKIDIHFSSYIPASHERKLVEFKYTQIYCYGFKNKIIGHTEHNLFELVQVHNFRIRPYWFTKKYYNEEGLVYQFESYEVSYQDFNEKTYNDVIGYRRLIEK